MKIGKIFLLILFWLLFSPLFIIMAKRWGMMKLKFSIPIALFSPVGLILIAFIGFGLFLGYDSYYRTHHYTDIDVIENITGIRLPEFKIVDSDKGNSSFTGDYTDVFEICFKEDISLSTFTRLDSIVKLDGSKWSKREDEYSYSIMWGNGLPAPKGESAEDDGTFSLQIQKGSKNATIEHGTW